MDGILAVVLGGVAAFIVLRQLKPKRKQPLRTRDVRLANMPTVKQHIEKLDNDSTLVRPYSDNPAAELVDYSSYKGPFHQVDPLGHVEVRTSKTGVAAQKPVTMIQAFERAAERNGDEVALVAALPDTRTWTWREYLRDIKQCAHAMHALGVRRGDSVNIIGFNSPEWLIADVAGIFCGAKAAGIYTTNGPEACHYISEHSGAVVVVCQDAAQTAKFTQLVARLPRLKAIVQWEGEPSAEARKEAGSKVQVLSWAQLMELGAQAPAESVRAVEQIMKETRPGDPCTLIYTSGTTGNPKAVMISHDNATWTALVTWSVMLADVDGLLCEEAHSVSYLPLSHIAAQMLDIIMPVFAAAYLEFNLVVYCADKNALKGTLRDTLLRARPTFFFGVPRVWEKFMAAMVEAGRKNTGLKKVLSTWARGVGAKHALAVQNGGGSSPLLWPIAKVLLKKARAAVGLDKCLAMATGAAPINAGVLNFFASVNMPVLELFGMSENTGPTTMSFLSPNKQGWRIGSAGCPLPGTELKIVHVDGRDEMHQGEICFRGRHIMMGYMSDANKTSDAIDKDGWLHSGDTGRVDGHGMLYITGRIKELIITKGGENIAPVPVEEL